VSKIPDALRELDAQLEQIGGCGDGYCIIVKPKGMHTNGGCRCAYDRHKMQRFAFAHNRFIAAIRQLGEPKS
jgi:hypothetical protein